MSNPYRLGPEIQPHLYDLSFRPDLDKITFEAEETLHFDLIKPAAKLVLHALDLRIRSAELETGGARLKAKKTVHDPKLETVAFDFGRKLLPGTGYKLRLQFSGVLNDHMNGFYRTSYSIKGKKHWGAATQFEATDARRAFPCVDEPDRKSRFRVTLTVKKHLTALSNMPVQRQAKASRGRKALTYEITPVMPTYLLCMVIAELECVSGRDKDGVPINIYTTPGKKAQGKFALDVARHTIPYFSQWFGIPYMLPKCDMVALPDFAAGAMENWGLITYRETALLVDEKNSSAAARQRVAEVIDHELAHQWFGNLVTMRWWTDLWLNEGFASYMGPKAVDHQFPQWNVWSQFVASETLTALHDDALKNTHPIEIPVKDPHEIREIFDHITYNKGAAVNRMLEHYLGEAAFRNGLRRYLKRFAYKNAETIDLWKALEEVSGQPVRAIMATFTKQEGYPVLEAKLAGKKLRVEQRRFTFDGSRDPKGALWKVPLTAAVQGEKRPHRALLSARRADIPLPLKEGAWVKLNPGQSGFYRASYSPELQRPLVVAMRRGEIAPVDAMGLIDDALAQARAGLVRSSALLDLVNVCREETDYNLWLTVSGAVGAIEHIAPASSRSEVARFAKSLFRSVARRSGWDAKASDSHLDILRRSLVISRLGHFGEATVINEARSRFSQFTQGKALDPNLRGAVYSVVAEHGGASEFSQLQALYKRSELQEEKVRLLRAFTRFRRESEIRKVLEFSLSPEVRSQDTYVLLAGFGSNDAARDLNWEFVKKEWKKISSRYTGGSVGIIGHILEGAVSGYKDAQHLEDAQRFFAANPVPGTERTRRQALEVIRSNIDWSGRDGSDIGDWLEAHSR